MRNDRRGLWWICNEFKPLLAYTKMVVSLWFSFEDFSQVFPMRVLWGLYWMSAQWCWFFVQVFSQWGFLGSYFSVQSKTVSWELVSCIGLRGVFDDSVEGLVIWLVRIAKFNGWLWWTDIGGVPNWCQLGTCVWVTQPHTEQHNNTNKLPWYNYDIYYWWLICEIDCHDVRVACPMGRTQHIIKSYCYCLAIRFCRIAKVHLATLERQIISKS